VTSVKVSRFYLHLPWIPQSLTQWATC
jgi:hypothetical protein